MRIAVPLGILAAVVLALVVGAAHLRGRVDAAAEAAVIVKAMVEDLPGVINELKRHHQGGGVCLRYMRADEVPMARLEYCADELSMVKGATFAHMQRLTLEYIAQHHRGSTAEEMVAREVQRREGMERAALWLAGSEVAAVLDEKLPAWPYATLEELPQGEFDPDAAAAARRTWDRCKRAFGHPAMSGAIERMRAEQTRRRLAGLARHLEAVAAQRSRLPALDEVWELLAPNAEAKDAWGMDLQYEASDCKATLGSLGQDRRPGGEGLAQDLVEEVTLPGCVEF